MNRPRVIVHNSVSIDAAYAGFDVDLGVHYDVAARFGADFRLIGSETAKTGFETYGLPPERPEDFARPEKDPSLPYWVIVDSGGRCQGMLHGMRAFDGCRDVIVLVSERTPETYRDYLRSRNYRWHVIGSAKVDLQRGLQLLKAEYAAQTVLTDTGPTLVGVLMNGRLVDQISLLVHPVIVGSSARSLFSKVEAPWRMKPIGRDPFDGGLAWCRYEPQDSGQDSGARVSGARTLA